MMAKVLGEQLLGIIIYLAVDQYKLLLGVDG